MRTFLLSVILTAALFWMPGCKKLVDVEPPITSVNGESVFRDDVSAISAVTGIYTNISKASVVSTDGWLNNIFFTTGLAADELMLFDQSDGTFGPYFTNSLSPSAGSTWNNVYKIIFVVNSAIEGLNDKSSVSPLVKKQLLGECRFMRAFCYSYLVNLYGDVPLALSSNYSINRLLPRESSSEIYSQIIADLKSADSLLSDQYVKADAFSVYPLGASERVRPNKWAAKALMARVMLYERKYAEAEAYATEVINNSSLYELVDISSVFLKNNKEAIWQIQPVGSATSSTANTAEGLILKLPPEGPGLVNPVYLREDLPKSFEKHDMRRLNWIDSVIANGVTYYYPYKYKLGRVVAANAEYSTVLRLAEVYLIRSESRIHQGRINEGIADMNIIRHRATDLDAPVSEQLPALSLSLSKAAAIHALEMERQHELFTEWGHRWLDLKRTEGFVSTSVTRADELLSIIKGSNWQETDKLFPIPLIEMQNNPSLIGNQNPGYN